MDVLNSHIPDWVTAATSAASTIGVFAAFRQLQVTKRIAQLQFEDGLAREYRELAEKIPTKVFLGDGLTEAEYQDVFDDLYRYIDLTNAQIVLRQRKRIGDEVWDDWRSGMKSNFALGPFKRAWSEVKDRTTSFEELRQLEAKEFNDAPRTYRWLPFLPHR